MGIIKKLKLIEDEIRRFLSIRIVTGFLNLSIDST